MRLRFGPFTIDIERRELRRDSEPLHLPPKAFQLLEMLIENRPKAVAQKTLYDVLWPDTYVDPSNIHNLIHQIRDALEDGDQNIIRTIYGFGFAFAATAVADEVRPAPMWQIVIGNREIDLGEGENIIGRERNAAVNIDSPSISRHHARVIVSSDGATLEDLGSKNGTALNGRRVRNVRPIADGDRVTFGTIAGVFHALRAVKSTETVR